MIEENSDPRLLKLSPSDNVLVLKCSIKAGETIQLDGETITIPVDLPLGHKIAASAIAPGERVIKYGVPIGSATQSISPGNWVHTHNLKSGYLPTWLREDQLKLFGENY